MTDSVTVLTDIIVSCPYLVRAHWDLTSTIKTESQFLAMTC